MRNEYNILCFWYYFRHLWNYNENKNHIYCVFRLILHTSGIIMRNKNNIYRVFRIILHTYGIIMRNENHIYCVLRIILDTYGIIMRNKNHIFCFLDYFKHLLNFNWKI